MTNKTIVISDLHVGSGALDDCDQLLEDGLVDFLGKLSGDDGPVELVINGDFLDFVQAEPWRDEVLEADSEEGEPLCFTQDQSVRKLESVAKAHAPIFKALGEFVGAKGENRLVVLPGNHDADFFWPDVKSLFVEKVSGGSGAVAGRVEVLLEAAYYPPSAPRVRIEHGHQYDPNNRFFRVTDRIDPYTGTYISDPIWSAASPPILKEKGSGTERLYECPGTRFLIRFMNALDEKFPFVDNVKPFSRFLRIFGVSTFKPGYGPLRAAAAVWRMFSYLSLEGIENPGSLLSQKSPSEGFGPAPLLADAFGMLTDEEMRRFVGMLQERGFSLDRPPAMYVSEPERAAGLMTFISKYPELLEVLERDDSGTLGASAGTLSMAKAFFVDETEALTGAARGILDRGEADHVIMGHTHEKVEGVRYTNTGCWTRYYQFGGDEEMRSWEILKTDSYELFPYQLRYAEIVPGRDPLVSSRIHAERPSHDRHK